MSPSESAATVLQGHAVNMMGQTSAIRGDAVTARQHISAITDGRCTFRVGNPHRFGAFRSAQAHLGTTAFQILRWEADTECQTATERSLDQHIVFHVVLRGQFEVIQAARRAGAREGQLLVASAPGRIVREWQGDCDLLNIVIPRHYLVRCLATEFHLDGIDDVDFDPLTLLDLTAVPTAASMLEMIMADLASSHSAFASNPLSLHAERLLALVLLKAVPHKHRSLLGERVSRVAPFYVRRAEAYMRRNLDAEIRMTDLSSAAGVSLRTIHYGFRHHRNASPMRYLKHLRLDHARELLLTRGNGERVARVALQVGYSSASQFSRDYKTRFGESPQATLQRAMTQPDHARKPDSRDDQ